MIHLGWSKASELYRINPPIICASANATQQRESVSQASGKELPFALTCSLIVPARVADKPDNPIGASSLPDGILSRRMISYTYRPLNRCAAFTNNHQSTRLLISQALPIGMTCYEEFNAKPGQSSVPDCGTEKLEPQIQRTVFSNVSQS
jgi:hypothetical protein